MTEMFSSRIAHIFFVYGLAFFALGLALALELSRALDSRFKRTLRPLVVFGLVHGFHEWFEMFEIIGRQTYGFVPSHRLEWVRLAILAFSFVSLSAFGVQSFHPPKKQIDRDFWIGLAMVLLYALGVLEIGAWLEWSVPDWLKAADVWTRYVLGIPAALLAAWGLLIQRRNLLKEGLGAYVKGLRWAALAFALYGGVGQFVTAPSALFPSTVINSEWFLGFFGMPVQLFRAFMATFVAIFTIRALRAFDVTRRRQFDHAQRQAQRAVERRDALRGELLRRSVDAQEEDRRRIARELHDEIGQTLTGLAAGLRGVQKSLNGDLGSVHQKLRQLEGMTVKAIDELGHLVADLRPSLLDDMGLRAALDWYTSGVNQRSSIEVELVFSSPPCRLPPEVETTLFRITQEALSNVVRHARANRAVVELTCDDGRVRLEVSDDGIGFDPATVLDEELRPGWGLVGIRERAQMAGGECHIKSAPGEGTTVTVEIPVSTAHLEGKRHWHPSD